METTQQNKELLQLHEVELIYRPKFKISTRPVIKSSKDVYEILQQVWNMDLIQLQEQVKVLLFNSSNRLLGVQELSSGGIKETVADPRLIFAAALKANASILVLAHNHPGGFLKPSRQDIELTLKIREGARFLEISVLDHLIISSEGYLSMADEGLI